MMNVIKKRVVNIFAGAIMSFVLTNVCFCLTIADSIEAQLSDRTVPLINRYHLAGSIDKPEQQIHVFNALLREAKNDPDKAITLGIYTTFSRLYLNMQAYNLSKRYLDSAFVYKDEIKDNGVLGGLYYRLAEYYRIAERNDSMAVKNCYLAISYYEKTSSHQIDILNTLYRIAYFYMQRFDDAGLKKIADRMIQLAAGMNDPEALFITYPVIGVYYRLIYNKGEDVVYLDSVYKYDKKTVDAYGVMDSAGQKKYLPKIAMYYSNLVDVMSILPDPDWKSIAAYIDKGTALLSPADTNAIVRNHHIRSRALFNQKKLDQAIVEALAGLDLLLKSNMEANMASYYDLYAILSEIYEMKKDYENAFKYEQKRAGIIRKMNEIEGVKTIKELQTRYEVAKKEEDIQQLTERNRYQERIRYLTLGILGLTLLAAILGFLWFRRKRRSDADALKIAKLQQQEAELKAEVEAAKFEEKEQEFDALASDMEMRQIKSYLDGLEAERARLAGELHDNVSNALLGIEFKMRTPGTSLEEISGMLHGTHEHVRNISHALMPPVFQHATLAEIIADYVYMQNGMSGPRFECHIEPEDGWEDLPQETALELHRIVQEACGNALKHSGASNISITLQRNGDRVTLVVKDNGRGMDIDSKKTGLGLQIIRDRAAKMNGSAEVISASGKGTTITVTV